MDKYIPRILENEVIKLAKSFPVVMITGPRQVGKSTMLDFIASKTKQTINKVSLDDLTIRALAINDPKLFLETYQTPLIIDEFQYAPELLSYIKIIVDNKRLEEFKSDESSNGLYYLTGSQSFLALEQVSESLAGRIGIVNLYGLSNREINRESQNFFIPEIDQLKENDNRNNNLTIAQLYERIFKGGFPELYKNNEMSRDIFYENYLKTYIEKDIRQLINVKDEVKFMNFMVSIAARSGQELNINDVCNDVEVSNATASNWLSILINTGLVILLEPYSKNILKRVVKRPKLYFMDTGLASYLTKFPTSETLEISYYAGAIFETYVVTEIVKSFTNKGMDPKRYLYYYRDNNKKEIDLIIYYNNKLYPIEIKKSKNPGKDATKNFSVLSDTGIDIAQGTVLCLIDDIFPIDKDNFCIPIRYI